MLRHARNMLYARGMSTIRSGGAKARRKERETALKSRWAAQKDENLPSFSTLLRQVYRKAHPDVLRAKFPEHALSNDKSMQVLNGVLSTIKTQNEYPAAIVQTIPFFLLQSDAEGGGTRCVELKIKTAGGDCRRTLTQSFESFFEAAITGGGKEGYGNRFIWEEDYFPITRVEISSSAKSE